MIKAKGLKEILEESPSLTRKITYEEFMNGATAPIDSDVSIETAYEYYEKMCEQNLCN